MEEIKQQWNEYGYVFSMIENKNIAIARSDAGYVWIWEDDYCLDFVNELDRNAMRIAHLIRDTQTALRQRLKARLYQ